MYLVDSLASCHFLTPLGDAIYYAELTLCVVNVCSDVSGVFLKCLIVFCYIRFLAYCSIHTVRTICMCAVVTMQLVTLIVFLFLQILLEFKEEEFWVRERVDAVR